VVALMLGDTRQILKPGGCYQFGKILLAKSNNQRAGRCFYQCLDRKSFGDAQTFVSIVFSMAYKLKSHIKKNYETKFMLLWYGFIIDRNARVMALAETNRP
jgi:hypothetical protein